ncbi:hypothetical protein EFS38_15505 [Dickeya undicola]|uniref:Uncharacterized protein n=1 Tax=Dickeya undicola TaxID=1577887 RepID=A0ABX9WQU6_9GAMM|nr:hypothetical protein EFS38_15505 [Dickeya undicola]
MSAISNRVIETIPALCRDRCFYQADPEFRFNHQPHEFNCDDNGLTNVKNERWWFLKENCCWGYLLTGVAITGSILEQSSASDFLV